MIHNNFDLNFIFIHIPKCGGTSIEEALGVNYHKNIGFDFENKYKKDIKYHPKHFKLKHYEELLGSNVNNYFKFTLIRNPWERMVSNYLFDISSPEIMMLGKTTYEEKKEITFEEFLNLVFFSGIETFVYDYQSWYNGVDYVCKLENIQSDFSYVCGRLGIDNREIGHINKTNNKSDYKYQEFYTSKTKDLIFEKFKYDILKFKYEF